MNKRKKELSHVQPKNMTFNCHGYIAVPLCCLICVGECIQL